MKYEYLVVYHFKQGLNSGWGRTFVTTDGELSAENHITEMENGLKEEVPEIDELIIINFQLLRKY